MNEKNDKSLYDLLGVSFYASDADVRQACEVALGRLKYKVGVSDDALAAERRQLMQAYALLRDPGKRQQYNQLLARKRKEAQAAAKAAEQSSAMSLGTAAVGPSSAEAPVAATGSPAAPVAVEYSSFIPPRSATVPANQAHATTATLAAGAAVAELRGVSTPSGETVRDQRVTTVSRRLKSDRNIVRDVDGDIMINDRELTPAALGPRFTAMLLDTAFVWILSFILLIVKLTFWGSGNPLRDAFATTTMLALFAVGATYYARCESGHYQSTWGKRLMGMRVIRSDGYEAVGRFRGVLRYFLRGISTIFMLGYIMAFFSDRKQAFHDWATDSVVVADSEPPGWWPYVAAGLFVVLGVMSFKMMSAAVTATVAGPAFQGMEAAKVLAAEERIDSSRASPTQGEVEVTYSAGLSLQRAMADYRRSQGRWPSEAELPEVINASGRVSLLTRMSPHMLIGGGFTLSLGATAEGTARLNFWPMDDRADTEWSCESIRVAESEQIDACYGSE